MVRSAGLVPNSGFYVDVIFALHACIIRSIDLDVNQTPFSEDEVFVNRATRAPRGHPDAVVAFVDVGVGCAALLEVLVDHQEFELIDVLVSN